MVGEKYSAFSLRVNGANRPRDRARSQRTVGWKGMRDKEARGQSFVKSWPFVSLPRNYSRIHRKLEGFPARRASTPFLPLRVSTPRVIDTSSDADEHLVVIGEEKKCSCFLFRDWAKDAGSLRFLEGRSSFVLLRVIN